MGILQEDQFKYLRKNSNVSINEFLGEPDVYKKESLYLIFLSPHYPGIGYSIGVCKNR